MSVSLPTEAMQWVEQGQESYQAGEFAGAATDWERAAERFAAQGDRINQAMALSNLSLTYQQLGQWQQAEQYLNDSLTLLRSQKNSSEQERVLAATLDIQGQLQLARGEVGSALGTWQEAVKRYEAQGDRNGKIRSQINQAQALQKLGMYPRACQTLLDALGLESPDCDFSEAKLQSLQELPVNSLQVLGLRSLGNVLRVMGKTQQSQKVLLISGQFAQSLGDNSNLAAIYLSLGNTMRALGNSKIEQERFRRQSLTFAPSLDCLQSQTSGKATEDYQQAAICYRQAAAASASPSSQIQAELNLLNLLIQTQKGAEILPLLSQIQTNRDRLSVSHTNIEAQLKLAHSLICLQSGLQQPPSEVSYQIRPPNPPKLGGTENYSKSPRIGEPVRSWGLPKWSNWRGFRGQSIKGVYKPDLVSSPLVQQCSFGQSSLEASQIPSWDAIRQLLTAVLNQARSLGDQQAEANAIGYLGGVAQEMGNLAEAQQFTEQALQRLSAFANPDLAYLWQWQLGRLYQRQGDSQNALQAYNLSFKILQSLRQDLVATNPDIQFTFRDSVEPVYRELVDLLLQGENPSQDSLKQARDVIETLQLAELNNFFREACLEKQTQAVEQVDPQAALIYTIILPSRLALIVSLPKQPLRYYATPLKDSGEIERTFDDLFATLNPFISSPDPLRSSQQFYDWLIRPLEKDLPGSQITTLVFVLDGVLRGVPLAALHDGQKYLIEKYNLALTPGLQLLNPRSLDLGQVKTLAGGLAEARQGFSSLPGVKQEVQEIASTRPTQVLLDQNFTRDRLSREIQATPFSVVHLATHGQFSSQAETTFLLTWDERINVKELDQLLQEREPQSGVEYPRSRQTPIELLILSACQTAVGDNRAALGLAGIAVRSGARSTLATLWSVQDRSTVNLMAQFYGALNQPGTSKSAALRQAQLSLLRSPQYQHPFYWAAFVLVGNWL